MMFSLFHLFACSSDLPSIQEMKRAEIVLDHGWDHRLWDTDLPPRFPKMNISTTVDIDSTLPIDGSSLELSGLWYVGTVSINGEQLSPFYGGLHSVEVMIGEHLRYGKNNIQIAFSAPTNISERVTGGSLSSKTKKGTSAAILVPPKLHLRPATHISGMTIKSSDGTVTPIAWIENPLEGLSITFTAKLDGKTISKLGECPISTGQSICSATKFRQPQWNIGQPFLFHLVGELRHNGKIIDQYSIRTGARTIEWDKSTLKINQKSANLLAARMVAGEKPLSFSDRLKIYSRAKINTLEFHGEHLNKKWLDYADELGMAIAIVPRCIGRCPTEKAVASSTEKQLMSLADHRLIWDTYRHPSVTMFVLEGDYKLPWNKDSLWTETLQNNLHNIPIFGLDLPAKVLQVSRNGSARCRPGLCNQKIDEHGVSRCVPDNCSPSWIIESIMMNGFVPWSIMSSTYADIHQQGLYGGVIPTPNQRDIEIWSENWSSAAARINPDPIPDTRLRSNSDITIINAAPNSIVTVSHPGHQLIGAITNNNGSAKVQIYFKGDAEVNCGEVRQKHQVLSSFWEKSERISRENIVDCGYSPTASE